VKPGDTIYIGKGLSARKAIVSLVYTREEWVDRVEAVYLDNKNIPIAEDFRWDGTSWQFASADVDATYAERSERLKRYADMLYSELPSRRRRRRQ